ncbi:hypothetical protein CYMTET_48229 [Cymbomonas tetramitiformis]|uniref:Uncharacterized protein n=1 Tax=Cymbomonas tetramitiformis TaxID=36881 RepID=A0AAE0BTR3_9CHLO|nr:hypothetical protein CYMTET_48229 [Cymbomonas tetramitiformis]
MPAIVAKCVLKKIFGNKESRFTAVEHRAASLFSRLVDALREAFITEDTAFASLFALDYATLTAAAAALSITSFAYGSVGRRFGDPPLAEPCKVTEDLVEIVLDLKRQVKALAGTVSGRGFTPRADKPLRQNTREMKCRFAAKPLPEGGGWTQTDSAKVAFHKGSGQTILFCGNHECMRDRTHHWHRDCPRGAGNEPTSGPT